MWIAFFRKKQNLKGPTDFADLLRLICNTFRNCTRIFLLSGDWRHWFHQMRLHAEVAKYFSLTIKHSVTGQSKAKRTFYNWTCLPMGWSWSPWIAQCVGYGIIILTLLKMGLVIPDSILQADSPPPYILLTHGTSTLFVCLWIDNVLVVTDDGNLCTKFYSAFDQTCISRRDKTLVQLRRC